MATKKMETPVLQGVTWKRWAVMRTSYSWGDSDWTQEENFSREQSVIGIISPGKWLILQHWTLLTFSWAGCWTILSKPCFCQASLDQMILEFPSNLVFYDSNTDDPHVRNLSWDLRGPCLKANFSNRFHWFPAWLPSSVCKISVV